MLNFMGLRIVGLLFSLGLAMAPLSAANPADYALIIEKATTNHARPRLANLVAQTQSFETMIGEVCASGGSLDDPAIIAQFEATALAWTGVSHLRWGPASEDFRYGRMFFGADPADFAWKKLIVLLYTMDSETFKLENFRNGTIPIQGLTAMEHVLFRPMPVEKFDAQKCPLAYVIAQAMRKTAGDIQSGWREDAPYIKNLNDPDPSHPFVQNQTEAAMQFFKPLGGGLPYMVTLDFKQPLQKSVELARPTYINYGRSNLSQAALLEKISAFADLYRYGGFAEALAPAKYDLHKQIMEAFARTHGAISAIKPPLTQAVTQPETRAQMQTAVQEIEALWHLLSYDMAEHFGFVIGFNLFDGD